MNISSITDELLSLTLTIMKEKEAFQMFHFPDPGSPSRPQVKVTSDNTFIQLDDEVGAIFFHWSNAM